MRQTDPVVRAPEQLLERRLVAIGDGGDQLAPRVVHQPFLQQQARTHDHEGGPRVVGGPLRGECLESAADAVIVRGGHDVELGLLRWRSRRLQLPAVLRRRRERRSRRGIDDGRAGEVVLLPDEALRPVELDPVARQGRSGPFERGTTGEDRRVAGPDDDGRLRARAPDGERLVGPLALLPGEKRRHARDHGTRALGGAFARHGGHRERRVRAGDRLGPTTTRQDHDHAAVARDSDDIARAQREQRLGSPPFRLVGRLDADLATAGVELRDHRDRIGGAGDPRREHEEEQQQHRAPPSSHPHSPHGQARPSTHERAARGP